MKYQPACQDVREMLLECVIESDCLKLPNSTFRYKFMIIKRNCIASDSINQECKAIRYDYMLCRKSVVLLLWLFIKVYWTKHHCKDDPR